MLVGGPVQGEAGRGGAAPSKEHVWKPLDSVWPIGCCMFLMCWGRLSMSHAFLLAFDRFTACLFTQSFLSLTHRA